MAAKESQRAKNVEDLLKNLKLDPARTGAGNSPGPKEGILSDATSCISSGDATSSIKESDIDQDSLISEQNQSMYYPANQLYAYYYPELDYQSYLMGPENYEVQHPEIQKDSGSLVYWLPGAQPGYAPYSSFFPGAVIGVDGQYASKPYYAAPIYPQAVVSPGYFSPSVAYGPELFPTYWDPSLYADGFPGYTIGLDPELSNPKPSYSSRSEALSSEKTPYERKGSYPATDAFPIHAYQNQYLKQTNKAAAASAKGFFPTNKFPSYSNNGKGNLLYDKGAGRSWLGTEKLKNKNKNYAELELLNEQNRGPRTNNGAKIAQDGSLAIEEQKSDGFMKTLPVSTSKREDYNLLDFPTKYDHALFFVIKSYSEDDIHKSIKYNVWSSTPNGNKILDNAYQVALEKMAGKGIKCPVFLFFSVNASGQFCGVAEMTGRVDFSRNMDFWQQDRWNGFFPVKWHIIKDLPNPQFRHIILENNENKPVTNSRDTQEVKFPQGTEMLNIFKSYAYKSSLLDDFEFYESRQKAMQEKKARHMMAGFEHAAPRSGEAAEVHKLGDSNRVAPTQAAATAVADEPTEGPPPPEAAAAVILP